MAAVLAALALAACESDAQKTSDTQAEGREVFGAPGAGAGAPAPSGANASSPAKAAAPAGRAGEWFIVLATFTGDDAAAQAESAAEFAKSKGGVADAIVEPRKKGAVVVTGGYSGPDDPRVRSDLERIRSIQSGGRALYPGAFLAPRGASKTPTSVGSSAEFDLARAKEIHGKGAVYTYQIGVYESPDRNEARRKAEEAAVELRREGEMAFFYHGPTMSLVTIGLFGREVVSSGDAPPAPNPELEAIQKRHPYNLYNGKGVQKKRRIGNEERSWMEPSGLVQVP